MPPKNKELVKTSERIVLPGQKKPRVVYKGPRGASYVRLNNRYVSVRNLKTVSKQKGGLSDNALMFMSLIKTFEDKLNQHLATNQENDFDSMTVFMTQNSKFLIDANSKYEELVLTDKTDNDVIQSKKKLDDYLKNPSSHTTGLTTSESMPPVSNSTSPVPESIANTAASGTSLVYTSNGRSRGKSNTGSIASTAASTNQNPLKSSK